MQYIRYIDIDISIFSIYRTITNVDCSIPD